jgi:type I restriction enzyme M protein
MFIQSAKFVEAHKSRRTLTPALSQGARVKEYSGNPTSEISVHGQERVTDTSRLARLNLAVHGLSGEIKQGNTYYEDLQDSVGRFDFVMANPPFNVSKIDKDRLAGDPRYAFGIPRTDNGNYLWIQHFHAALKPSTGSGRGGRAGFVMANSAADARASEQEIREKIIRSGDVDVMVAIGPNFFFTVTLPCTLWFFDKGKKATDRAGKVLFIDARHIFRQLDRAHRDFTEAQIEFISNLVRFYRGEDLELDHGSETKWEEIFGDASSYHDIPGLCKAATLAEIEAQGWSLNPGRYVGVAKGEDFKEKLEALNEELEVLNNEARELEARIAENVSELLEA